MMAVYFNQSKILSLFVKKFPSQNKRQIKKTSHNVLQFWYSTRSKNRQLTKSDKGKPNIHTVRKTRLTRLIQVRNRSCFYILCKNNVCYKKSVLSMKLVKKKIVSMIYSFWYLKTDYYTGDWCFVIYNESLWADFIEKISIMNDTQIFSILFFTHRWF